MNGISPALESAASPSSQETAAHLVSAAEVDRSCYTPFLTLATSALTWLLLGGTLAVISSIKLHAAGFLAECPWLTYGRVRPAFVNALTFGFASQAGLAAAIWILARLGRNVVQGTSVIAIAVLFWNLGLAMGVIGILAGHSTGYEWIELPGYATPILFLSYLVIGICAVLTFHARHQRELYASQWYLLAALLCFPWVYSTGQLLLVFSSARGILQEVINGWVAHNLLSLWLTPLGLAIVFYFVPKLTNRPLYSRSLAVFGFWLLAVFGSLGGLPAGTPVPKWLTSIGVVGVVLGFTAVLAVATNWHLTLTGMYARCKTDLALRFILGGAACYLIVSWLQTIGVLRTVNTVTEFTHYSSAIVQLYFFGFWGMTFSGAIYYIVPRMINAEWPLRAVKFHFWTSALGTVLVVLPLVVGGVSQGLRLNDPKINFLDVVGATKPFLGTSTLGGVLLLAGIGAALYNLCRLLCAGCCGYAQRNAASPSKHGGRKA